MFLDNRHIDLTVQFIVYDCKFHSSVVWCMSVNVNQRMAIILWDLAFGLGRQIEAVGYKLSLKLIRPRWTSENLEIAKTRQHVFTFLGSACQDAARRLAYRTVSHNFRSSYTVDCTMKTNLKRPDDKHESSQRRCMSKTPPAWAIHLPCHPWAAHVSLGAWQTAKRVFGFGASAVITDFLLLKFHCRQTLGTRLWDQPPLNPSYIVTCDF